MEKLTVEEQERYDRLKLEIEDLQEQLAKLGLKTTVYRRKTWDGILSKHLSNFIGIVPYKQISAAVEEYTQLILDECNSK